MKKDINFPVVEGVSIAIIYNEEKMDEFDWFVYIINRNDYPIENIIVASKGYGVIEGREKETSILRKLINHLKPKSYQMLEPIDPKLFALSNEFSVTYYVDDEIYDKKFIFLPESVREENMTEIPLVNERGILHN